MGKVYASVNVYRKPVMVEDPDELRAGFWSTLLYAAFTISALVVIAAYLYQEERVFEIVKNNPSYADYLKIEEKLPTCPCNAPTLQFLELDSVMREYSTSIPREYDVAFATSSLCDLATNVSLVAPINGEGLVNRTANYLMLVVYPAMDRCQFVSLRLQTALQALNKAQVPSRNLLDSFEFEKWVLDVLGDFETQLADGFISSRVVSTLVRSPAGAFAPSVYADEALAPVMHVGLPCRDDQQYGAFEYTIFGVASNITSCAVAAVVMESNVHSWNQDMLTAYGLSQPRSSFGDYTPSSGPPSFETYMFDAFMKFTERVNARSAIEVTDDMHEEYFAKCRPVRCTYTELRTPSWSELATLTLGLVGGLTTVLKAVVGVVGGMLCKRKKASIDPMVAPGDS